MMCWLGSDAHLYTEQSAYSSIFENKSNDAHKIVWANLAFMECRPSFATKDKDNDNCHL